MIGEKFGPAAVLGKSRHRRQGVLTAHETPKTCLHAPNGKQWAGRNAVAFFELRKERRIGILLGAGAAVGLRIVFAFIITQILGIPFLKALGGVLLVWIAIKLIIGEKHEEAEIPASDRLWKAVGTIAMADELLAGDTLETYIKTARTLMSDSLARLEEELSWFTQKFDYRNAQKPWGDSKDALERTVNKLRGWCLGSEPMQDEP